MNSPMWTIRQAMPSDIPFIYSSWLKSFKNNSDLGKEMRSSVFFTNYKLIIDRLLQQSEILVACMSEDPSVIYGYFVYETFFLDDAFMAHYCFIKEDFRKFGIASDLLKHSHLNQKRFEYSHKTDMLSKLNLDNHTYNPLALYKKQELHL